MGEDPRRGPDGGSYGSPRKGVPEGYPKGGPEGRSSRGSLGGAKRDPRRLVPTGVRGADRRPEQGVPVFKPQLTPKPIGNRQIGCRKAVGGAIGFGVNCGLKIGTQLRSGPLSPPTPVGDHRSGIPLRPPRLPLRETPFGTPPLGYPSGTPFRGLPSEPPSVPPSGILHRGPSSFLGGGLPLEKKVPIRILLSYFWASPPMAHREKKRKKKKSTLKHVF